MKTVMVNVLVQVVLDIDADNDAGAAEIAKDQCEGLVEHGLGDEPGVEYSIIQNNVVWITDKENLG